MRLELVARLSQATVDPLLPHWQEQQLGPSMRLHEGGTSVACSTKKGWEHALLDRWFTNGVTSVMLRVEEMADDLFIGVVGRNFMPTATDWHAPLSESRHAVVVHAGSGKVFHKGAPTLLALPLPIREAVQLRRQRQEEQRAAGPASPPKAKTSPSRRSIISSGSIVHLLIDMQRHELTVEVLAAENVTDVQSSVVIEGLPFEVGIALGFGPGEQRVRVLGIEVEESARSSSTPARKMLTDLWDDDHIVKPLRSTRSRRSRELNDHVQHCMALTHTAREC